MEETLTDLETVLRHRFSSRALLANALTHRSLANEEALAGQAAESSLDAKAQAAVDRDLGNNERMEFLGDAVLGLVVAEALFRTYPEWQEGELTRVRAHCVSRRHMAEVARNIGLGRYLRLSKGEERSGLRSKSTVLSNSMEAVLGALFLDGGLEPVRGFAREHVMGGVVEHLASELRSGAALGNFKSALQEHLQAARSGPPEYRLKSASGPDHRKQFLVEVRIASDGSEPGTPLARGIGSTKKLAEQDAARRALELLKAAAKGSAREAADPGDGANTETREPE